MTEQHNCTLDSPSDAYGIAMDICYEKDDGTYWVSNGEYASQVNYCPVCGAKAPKQAEQRPLTDVTEAVTKTVIETEKLLCEKIGRQWQPSGMSIQTLVDELATLVAEREREACAKVCERLPAQQDIDVRDECAAAIRARGET